MFDDPPRIDPATVRAAIVRAMDESAEPSQAQPVAGPKDAHRTKRWVSLMGGGALDYGSTLHALSKDGLKEGNPIIAPIAGNPLALGAVKLGTNAGVGLLLNKLAKDKPKLALTLSLLLGGVQAGVGINNLRLASKQK